MTVGTEHEFSINDAAFHPAPVSDTIIRSICGRFEDEIAFGDVKLGKELQKSVLEFVPRNHAETIGALEHQLVRGLAKFHHIFKDRYRLLGLGMHPTLTLDQTAVWNHDEGEYYAAYNRLFSIRQHGWLNVQAFQVNLSYASEEDLLVLYNRTRQVLPFLVAVSASSPMVESRLTGSMDNRLLFYRENQKEIPAICNRIIPPEIRSVAEYHAAQEEVFAELRARNAGILCEEWLNSAGMIVRFSRKCLEIKALDEQECIRSDMAVCAFARSLLRCPRPGLPADRETLLALLEDAIRGGTAELRPELERLYGLAWEHATDDERLYLPLVRERIGTGSLAERIRDAVEGGTDIRDLLPVLSSCLSENRPFLGRCGKSEGSLY